MNPAPEILRRVRYWLSGNRPDSATCQGCGDTWWYSEEEHAINFDDWYQLHRGCVPGVTVGSNGRTP